MRGEKKGDLDEGSMEGKCVNKKLERNGETNGGIRKRRKKRKG